MSIDGTIGNPPGRPPAIGLSLPTWPGRDGKNVGWPEMRRLALEVEQLGVETLWVPDHFIRIVPGRPPYGFWECWTILTAAAEATSTIDVGPLVACTGFRNPALLAKMAATLDEVSGGRLVLGLGSGVPARDLSWTAYGYDGERHVSRHAEAVEVISRVLREPPVTFEGRFVRTSAADIVPRGPRAGGPPIVVAGAGDRTLAIAARWGDAINVNGYLTSRADADEAMARVAAACVAVGRDPGTLEVTGLVRIGLAADGTAKEGPGWVSGSPEEVVSTLRAIGDAGVRHLTIYLGDAADPSPLPALTRETLARFAGHLEALRAS